MIKIEINTPKFDDEWFHDSLFDLKCTIDIPNEATIEEAMWAFVTALQVDGYNIDKLRDNLSTMFSSKTN